MKIYEMMNVSAIYEFLLNFFFFFIIYNRGRSLNSDFTLNLICLASSLASLSAWLDMLPGVSGKRAVFIDAPQISQQKFCDLATNDIAQKSMFSPCSRVLVQTHYSQNNPRKDKWCQDQ